jgi:hypothetical protein
MAIGDALSKFTTYQKVIDAVRLRTNTVDEPRVSDDLIMNHISWEVQGLAQRLNGAASKAYTQTISTLTITGSANPYTVDLSSVAPFIGSVLKVVHVTAAGARTMVQLLQPMEAEQIMKLTTIHSGSIFGVYEGDSLRLYKGATFTITIGTDTVEMKYQRQPKIGTIASTALVYNATFTVAADGVTVSAVTGMTTALVGGIFVGTDSAANKFAKSITQYVSATSFIISGAVIAGSGTLGYIIPPNSNSYTQSVGSYLDIPDSFVSIIVDAVASKVAQYKSGGTVDANAHASVSADTTAAIQAFVGGEQLKEK